MVIVGSVGGLDGEGFELDDFWFRLSFGDAVGVVWLKGGEALHGFRRGPADFHRLDRNRGDLEQLWRHL